MLVAGGLQFWVWRWWLGSGVGGRRARRRKDGGNQSLLEPRSLRHNILAAKSHIAVIYAAEFASRYDGPVCACAQTLIWSCGFHVYKISPIKKRVARGDERLLALQTGCFLKLVLFCTVCNFIFFDVDWRRWPSTVC